jgi:hypothetical protein
MAFKHCFLPSQTFINAPIIGSENDAEKTIGRKFVAFFQKYTTVKQRFIKKVAFFCYQL